MTMRKQLLRCLVDTVVLTRLPSQEGLRVRIVWRGRADTEKLLCVLLPGHGVIARYPHLKSRIMELVEHGKSDAEIAWELSAQGFGSSHYGSLHKNAVARIRSEQDRARARSQKAPPGRRGVVLAVSEMAARLGVHWQWIYHRIPWGQIKLHLAPVFNRYLFPQRLTDSGASAPISGRRRPEHRSHEGASRCVVLTLFFYALRKESPLV